MRLMQHKKEAFWFYRFLSIFYDKYVNPLFWTPLMRDQSLELAEIDDPNLKIIDVGSGTGFTTQGIVKHIAPTQVTCVDQSPHQMAKAKAKTDLQGCTFKIGDAENIPAPTDHYDRYVSAGSIEYWPNPQQGINESYRVIKPGGVALMIGPLEPQNGFTRFMANSWMLFPKDQEYRDWYKNAGFENIRVKYVQPHWHRGENTYGIAISGTKPAPGLSPNANTVVEKAEAEAPKPGLMRSLQMIWRVLIGSLAGFIFIPIALLGYLVNSLSSQSDVAPEYRERLNANQWLVVGLILVGLVGLIWWLVV